MLAIFFRKFLSGSTKFYSYKEQQDYELLQEIRRERTLSHNFTVF